MKPCSLLPVTALCLLLQGCFFTGVESTPRITASDVKRAEVPLTREDTFLAHVADEPLREWRPGKPFAVTDPRVTRVFGLDESEGSALAGHTIRFVKAVESPGVTGSGVTDLLFAAPDGRPLTYRVNRPLESLMRSDGPAVPFTVQRDMAVRVDSMLRGRRLYTLTGLWRDDDDTPRRGLKFIPVTIDSVSVGNSLFPLKVAFTADSGLTGRLFIYPGATDSAPRTFASVFSFTDPWLRYPAVNPDHRDAISRGYVSEGMTALECRLALGAPKEINRGAGQSYLRETWSYEDGHYLLFEDGLLKYAR